MTFSTEIKNEITKLESNRLEYISELSALVRNSAIIDDTIKIVIENNAVARRVYKLLKEIYDVNPSITIRKRIGINKGYSYILEIKKRIGDILTDLSIMDKGLFLNIPKSYIYDDEDTKRAYLRGVFVSTGSINDPKTSRYHLEFIVDDNEYALFVSSLLNDNNLNSKVIRREKNYMVYVKEADKIADFLRIIKAYNAVMYFENIRIYKEKKNNTNRLNNCEQANMDKIFMTSSKQLHDIELLKKWDMIDLLDEKLQEVIKYRLMYPESSLQELSDIMSKDTGKIITKSGLNHRFRKIKEIVSNVLNKRE